jgi:hypothetical protein
VLAATGRRGANATTACFDARALSGFVVVAFCHFCHRNWRNTLKSQPADSNGETELSAFRYAEGTMTDEELDNLDMEQRPHVIILGAGASRAALPSGDGSRRPIPVMNDLVALTGVGELLEAVGLRWRDRNFEELYAELKSDDAQRETADAVEKHIRRYFEAMCLPDQPCLYDHLLLSLRSKDVIATFNWDPFLLDAYERNAHIRELPHVLFLHGSVGFLAGQWRNLRAALEHAFILTVFGYAAPVSDGEAVALMKEAWWKKREREIEQIELINTARPEELVSSWGAFFTRDHYEVRTCFYQSWSARHPRRSCEACWDQFEEIHVRQDSTIPQNADFAQLGDWFHPLLAAERAAKS